MKDVKYWKWKSTTIDFTSISDDAVDYNKYIKKKDAVFHYLGTPDEKIHEWYNGCYSCEYNDAVSYGVQLGLIEWYEDYEEEYYELQQRIENAIDVLEDNKYNNYEYIGEDFESKKFQKDIIKILKGE